MDQKARVPRLLQIDEHDDSELGGDSGKIVTVQWHSPESMIVPMMRVREMRMRVRQWLVTVNMGVASTWSYRRLMDMVVMDIIAMQVFVLMLERFVRVFVPVRLGQMQPDSDRHQHGSREQLQCESITERHGQQRAKEWRDGKICARSGGAQVAQRDHEQSQADAIS